jgi:hypothetical protein
LDQKTLSYRLFNCAWCSHQVRLCSTCDRGNRYCGKVCALSGRGRSVAAAGRRYQRTFAGAVKHGERNALYRARLEDKVTHQGSLPIHPHAILYSASGKRAESPTNQTPEFDEEGRTRCSVCAAFCGPFARMEFIDRYGVKNHGGKNEHFKGNRIRDSAPFLR